VKTVSGKRFAQILVRHGWRLVRVNGSHHVYMCEGGMARISLPIHGNQDLKIGILKNFMKIANITENDL
jgi:predicted RNA binding protein YcfA (HicA-like mRNA interferase family)